MFIFSDKKIQYNCHLLVKTCIKGSKYVTNHSFLLFYAL